MSRQGSDHEDMMAEAISLVPRIEFQGPSSDKPALIGINRNDWLFVYRDPDTMYRFDEQGRLRRAYIAETLYRTAGHTLGALGRQRTKSESLLLRRDLSPDELRSFRERMKQDLLNLTSDLCTGTILRQHPVEMIGIRELIQQRIEQVLSATEFLAPAIVRR